ncbi:hypothetical protein, partial [Alcanivorax sp.]|uniref:hypothetical protein n=1 Tax=Alcanivorax sp. TaxID=1872427 RepID=UPI0025C2CED8
GHQGFEFQDLSHTSGFLTMPPVFLDMTEENWCPKVNVWLVRLWNAAGFPECEDYDSIVNE